MICCGGGDAVDDDDDDENSMYLHKITSFMRWERKQNR